MGYRYVKQSDYRMKVLTEKEVDGEMYVDEVAQDLSRNDIEEKLARAEADVEKYQSWLDGAEALELKSIPENPLIPVQ